MNSLTELNTALSEKAKILRDLNISVDRVTKYVLVVGTKEYEWMRHMTYCGQLREEMLDSCGKFFNMKVIQAIDESRFEILLDL